MIIDWKDYVDQIYCITFHNRSKDYLYEELKRVDILNSGIYYEFENISTPFYKILYDTLFGNQFKDTEILKYSYRYDCTMAHYYCMKHARQNGYKKILILENDVVFLKNKKDIVEILEHSNIVNCFSDKGYIFLGSAAHPIYFYNEERKGGRNTCYQCTKEVDYDILKFNKDITISGGAAFNIYDDKAYNYFIDFIENKNFDVIDIYYRIYDLNQINIYFSNTYVCIQEDWFGLFLNACYNYPFDINKKERYLNHIFEDYCEYSDEFDIWAHPLLFNEINQFMYDNSLTENDYINKINEYKNKINENNNLT